MSSSSLHVSFKTKTDQKTDKKAAKLSELFMIWNEHVQEWRQKRWGLKYAEDLNNVWEGSRELVTDYANVCLGDLADAEKLHIASIYKQQYCCRRCKDLNDSKFKPYCTTCTERWKKAQKAKDELNLHRAISRHLSRVDTVQSEED